MGQNGEKDANKAPDLLISFPGKYPEKEGGSALRRYFFRRVPMARGQQTAAWCLVIAIALTVLFIVGGFHLRNMLSNLAVTRVSNTINRCVSEAINDAVTRGAFRYDRLIVFEKDNAGKITALETDMAEMNRLQSEVVADVLERVSGVSAAELSIPVGTLTGTPLLAGRGPRIPIKMEFTGSSTARFDNDFTEAGINQTKHRVLLYVDVSVSILLPGFSTYTKVTNAFTVAETVIVGSVPESYTYFHSDDSITEQAHEFIMNQ